MITSVWFSRQNTPWGWFNTIAFAPSDSQVCVAKHTSRQWEAAAWVMVITLTSKSANASFQEGAVRWASLMSVQEEEFIYLLLVWLNPRASVASDRVVVYLTMHYPRTYNQSAQLCSGVTTLCLHLENANTFWTWVLHVLKQQRADAGIKHECASRFALRWFFLLCLLVLLSDIKMMLERR